MLATPLSSKANEVREGSLWDCFSLNPRARNDDGGGAATEVQTAKLNRLSLPPLGGVSTDALAGELKNGGVVNQTVDRGHGRHWVFEDLVPLREHQVGGDDDRLLLIALGEEMEEDRSEEHTSELQSPCNLVCRLLLEKKK